MQREIKFRVFDKKNKKMCYDSTNDRDSWLIDSLNAVNSSLKSTLYIFLQYTGLKDSRGKEIYEGDIVKRTHLGFLGQEEHRIDEVVFRNGCFVLGNMGWYFWDYAQGNSDITVEVIGNIYENPELLTNNKETL